MSMDFLNSVVDKMEQTKVDLRQVCDSKVSGERVQKINPSEISSWEHRDRCDFELGDIDKLADSIELKGQAQPIVLVLANDVFKGKENDNCKYIVIAGYRRWLACKSRGLLVDAIIRELSFEQAISCLVSENEKEAVSDYSKGMFFSKLLNREGTTRKALYERLGIKKGMFDNYISFSEVPNEIWIEVGDLSKVSARTSATIKLVCQKSEAHKQAVIAISKKISEGIGEKKIISLVNAQLSNLSAIDKKESATRVALSKSIYMEYNKDQIKVFGLNSVSEDQYDGLKRKVTEVLENFIHDM
ncbi:MAG: ParB/RepB/Spo0J family partition protein [Legionellaceae bacterium]|nr:ParB/RepB/Spo0J family partition protein [Legionellaceae bacterium]